MNFSLPSAPRPPHRQEGPVAAPRTGGRNRGLTLIELLFVIGILAAIAGVVTVLYSDGVTVSGADGVERSPEKIATLATMQRVREALVGASTEQLGFYQHTTFLPVRVGALIEDLYLQGEYDPATKQGWNGPYISDIGVRFTVPYVNDVLGGGFFDPMTGDPWEVEGELILQNNDPIIPDAWRNPIVMGFGTHSNTGTTQHAFLVSAGKNRILETSLTSADYDADNDGEHDGDDIVLFLLTSDPNL